MTLEMMQKRVEEINAELIAARNEVHNLAVGLKLTQEALDATEGLLRRIYAHFASFENDEETNGAAVKAWLNALNPNYWPPEGAAQND